MKEYISILLDNDINLLKIFKDFKQGKIDCFMPKKQNQVLVKTFSKPKKLKNEVLYNNQEKNIFNLFLKIRQKSDYNKLI